MARQYPKQLAYWLEKYCKYRVQYKWERKCIGYWTMETSEGTRHFRLVGQDYRIMEICDGDMDRWANSYLASYEMKEMNEKEFKNALDYLLSIPCKVVNDHRDVSIEKELKRKHVGAHTNIHEFEDDEGYDYFVIFNRYLNDKVFHYLFNEEYANRGYDVSEAKVIHQYWHRNKYHQVSKNNKNSVKVTFIKVKMSAKQS